MLVAHTSIFERDTRFSVIVSNHNASNWVRFHHSPSLDTDIVELIFARFALFRRRHVDIDQFLLWQVEYIRADALVVVHLAAVVRMRYVDGRVLMS